MRRELSHFEYLARVLKDDQVFALLVGLMALDVVITAAGAVRQESVASGLVMPLFVLVMLVGVLTFQRLVHTILVWLAGVGIIMAGLGAVRLMLAPAHVDSGLVLLAMWFGWVLNVATMIFVLVVLCERRAYFEGAGSRPEPKRTRLREFLRREYLRHALARPGDRPEEPAPAPRTGMRSRPSEYEGRPALEEPGVGASMASLEEQTEAGKPAAVEPQAPEVEGLRPFGGGSMAKTTRGLDQERLEARAADYRVEPLPPAPGQADGMDWEAMKGVLNWGHIREMIRQDVLFGWLLAALALQAALTLMRPNFWVIAAAAVLIWGVLTLQRWGYYLALALAGLQALGHFVLLSVVRSGGQEVEAWVTAYALAVAALNLFILLALIARRHLFE
jgi:hypothetical protein